MSKKTIRHDGPCPIERVLDVFGRKWKPAIVFCLESEGTLRFNELRRLIPKISQRMLAQQLRELERDGVVSRKQYLEIPPRVEYSLTELGRSFGHVGKALEAWGDAHMSEVEKARERYDESKKPAS